MKVVWLFFILSLAATFGCDDDRPWECRRYESCQRERSVGQERRDAPRAACRDSSEQCIQTCKTELARMRCSDCTVDGDCNGHPAGNHCINFHCVP